jgi:hypothetical protein
MLLRFGAKFMRIGAKCCALYGEEKNANKYHYPIS